MANTSDECPEGCQACKDIDTLTEEYAEALARRADAYRDALMAATADAHAEANVDPGPDRLHPEP